MSKYLTEQFEKANETLLDEMLLDKWIYTLTRVGRKNMTAQELWQAWIHDKN